VGIAVSFEPMFLLPVIDHIRSSADTGNPQYGSILAQQVGELSNIRHNPSYLLRQQLRR